MHFDKLGLHEAVVRAASSEGYVTATPIQAQAIPEVLKKHDVLGCAQTGTGKTAAFAMPILTHLAAGEPSRRPRCLVLTPTRELAAQIQVSFRTYGQHLPLKHGTIFGGVSQGPQVEMLRRGLDVVIATPGRLMDLVQQRHIDLGGVEILVLDEADRMLDMGFIADIRRIVGLIPKKRQTLLFSATMPQEIRRLADSILNKPVSIAVTPVASTVDKIEQSVYMVEKARKTQLLSHLIKELPMYRTIVFTRTKHGADKVVKGLKAFGIESEAIHGNKTQNNRKRALDRFATNKIPVLVATDIASRGIDIEGITHVVNYDLTHEPESYVHRIGRTGRAGAEGAAISFCDREERGNLRGIEKLIRRVITVKDNPIEGTPMPPRETQGHDDRGPRPQGHRNNSRGGGRPAAPHDPRRGSHAAPREMNPNAPRENFAPAAQPRDGQRSDRPARPGVQRPPHPTAGRPGRGSPFGSTSQKKGNSRGRR
ncbi:MAG TPA: DEAD/DEAH box helicase [Tepidisphaeraceae bacterium]|jgi:ATP-dependent RNA helicase RhlE